MTYLKYKKIMVSIYKTNTIDSMKCLVFFKKKLFAMLTQSVKNSYQTETLCRTWHIFYELVEHFI